MRSHITSRTPILFLVAIFIAGCTSHQGSSTTPPTEGPNYTAAAQTIAAQLTEIAGSGAIQPTIAVTQPFPEAAETIEASETLPDTSTPYPTRTALTDNPLTVTQTSTLTPTTAGAVTPSFSPSDPRASLGEPDFSDHFTDGANWYIYNDNHVDIETQDGKLKMTALNADKYEAMMLSTQPIIDDFYMEITATTADCSGFDRYGLIFRAPGFTPIQGYLFGFTCDGKYSLRIFNGVDFTAIVQWTQSELINAGSNQTNRLGLSAVGNQLKLYANGKPLLELEDEHFSSGYFGLFIGAYATSGFTTSFSDFAYWLQPRK